MKRILTPILFFAFLHFSRAQVTDQDVPRTARDQVIPDDLIVQGSECVGFDCVNNENFGFTTIRLKENNLRIGFDDTSVGTFPGNDWEIEINESASGGTNHFAIRDVTGARVPFKIIAGAPTNSLFVASTGRLGLRTSNPVLDLHINTSNSPGVRLEQNNSGGFTAQTWDIAGNEANFFVRDVTGGSRLPFRIRPGAPTSSIDIAANGNVGIGTASPTQKIHILDSPTNSPGFLVEAGTPDGGTSNFIKAAAGGTASVLFYKDNRFLLFAPAATTATVSATQLNSVAVVGPTAMVGVGTWSPTEKLDVVGNIKVSGSVVPSDRRLKENVNDFNKGLAEVLKLQPVSFDYNGKGGTVEGSHHIGLIAQDLNQIVPEMVKSYSSSTFEESLTDGGGKSGEEQYLSIHDSEIKYLLINAIKDQQGIIEDQKEQLQTQDERITDLEAIVVELKNLIQDISNSIEVNLSGEDLGYLGQNVPNPYQGETTITYVIPGKAQESSINIYDVAGKFVKTVRIKQTGKGQLKINANNLPGGVYSYQLVVDGKVIDNKKMVLQN